ncbi:5'-nucleotidase C-terminal domain-containing protein [Cytobacillus massiliigabonensis]|uniref:5'-nucleotidase C-terminal domain-containing protein n=1 Tax=Cytobacillus massiliigabonensis TaxID=1871011 RepID=UPI0015E0AE04|nr:5'-nucleotidase C-terminal domain-containing protein [Cytobacillus massiliigabonensis]
MRKKKLITSLAAPAIALSLFGIGTASADTNFDAIKLSPMELMKDQGIIKGYPNGDLGADQPLKRMHLLWMLENAGELGSKEANITFKDVPKGYKSTVAKAVHAKIVTGDNKDKFGPNVIITKQEFAKMFTLSQTEGKVPDVDLSVLKNFTDADKMSDEMKPFIAYSILKGAFDFEHGVDFNPNAPMTRGEAAKAFKPVVFDVIDFLTTNDIHGNIEFNEKYQNGGMAIIGGLVNGFRDVNPDGTVVVDGGDIFQGTLISNSTEGASTFETLNEIKYDAAAIGNHEFDFGIPVLKDRIEQAEFPVLGANIYDEATNKRVDWAEPYTIVEKGGYKIGIIGFATPQTPSTTLATHIKGLSFPTPAPIAKELAAEMKAKGADFVIVTSHLPGEVAKESDAIIGELADLAKDADGSLDAIVGGHSHKRVAGHVNNIPVVEAQSYTAAMGHIQLFIDRKTGEVYSSESEILETKLGLTKEDQAVADIVKKHQDRVNEIKSEIVSITEGELTRDLSEGKFGVSQLGNMISDAMLERAKAQVAFQNAGGIRTNIDSGEITYGEVFAVLPFDNYNVVADMTAQQIKEILEGPAEDGWNFLSIQFGGLKVKFDETKPLGERIVDIELTDGTPLYKEGKFAEGTFKVVTNNFLSTGEGDDYFTFGEVEWTDEPDFQRELFADYLREMKKAGKTINATEIMDGRLQSVN